jgi:hypothetical protein
MNLPPYGDTGEVSGESGKTKGKAMLYWSRRGTTALRVTMNLSSSSPRDQSTTSIEQL